jgi:hypothetical protein
MPFLLARSDKGEVVSDLAIHARMDQMIFEELVQGAILAQRAAQLITNLFPVKGRPWVLEGADESAIGTATSAVFKSLWDVEQELNPRRWPVGSVRRSKTLGSELQHPGHHVALLAAFRALLHQHDLIIQYYGWEPAIGSKDPDRILARHRRSIYPEGPEWKFPDVPGIELARLTSLRTAAEALWIEASRLLPDAALHQLQGLRSSLREALVKEAADSANEDSVYRPAKDLLNPDGFPADFKELNRALRDNPCIGRRRPISKETGRPIPNRLEVHVGNWHAFLDQRKRNTPDPLDLRAEVVDATVQEVQRRKRQETLRKSVV